MQGQLPDFDTLVLLAKEDPEAFEQLREEQVNRVIQQSPDHLRRRLQGLQFQVDAKRQIATTPMQTCVEISRMMHESFEDLRCVLNQHIYGEPILEEASDQTAQILSFKSPAVAN